MLQCSAADSLWLSSLSSSPHDDRTLLVITCIFLCSFDDPSRRSRPLPSHHLPPPTHKHKKDEVGDMREMYLRCSLCKTYTSLCSADELKRKGRRQEESGRTKEEKPAGSLLLYISHWFPPLFAANKDSVKSCLSQWDPAQPCQIRLTLWKLSQDIRSWNRFPRLIGGAVIPALTPRKVAV